MGRYISAVIFDGDGVLFDSKKVHYKILERLREILGETRFYFHGADTIKEMMLAGLSREIIAKYREIFDGTEDEFGVPVFIYANGCLLALREAGIMTAAFSNRKFRLHTFRMIQRSGLDLSLLDFFMLHDSTPWRSLWQYLSDREARNCMQNFTPTCYAKPDNRAILAVKNYLKNLLDFPFSVIYVGDNIIDYDFAKACGFGFIGTLCGAIEDPEVWKKTGVVNIVDHIGEIPKMIERLI